MRSSNDDVIAFCKKVPEAIRQAQPFDLGGAVGPQRIHAYDPHPEGLRATADFRADCTKSNDAERLIRQMPVGEVDRADLARPGRKADACFFSTHWSPMVMQLVADVRMQVASEADDVAHDLVGDHVREEPAHVGQYTGMLDECRKQIVFQTGRKRLYPPQFAGG